MMLRSFLVAGLALASFLACGGSTAGVPDRSDSTNEQLQTRKDGSATGNGATCSWAGTSLADSLPAGAVSPTYSVGASFASLDGCNTCDCTGQGIMCTVKTCSGAADAGAPIACPSIAMRCPDGTYVGPTGPDCAMAPCVSPPPAIDGGVACPDLAKQCPDGTWVGPTGPNCDFVCPTGGSSCTTIATNAASEVAQVVGENLACASDSDCTTVALASDCFSKCSAALAKSGVDAFNAAIAKVDSAECKQFESQSCTMVVPPCVAPQTAHCVNKVCQ